MYYSITCIILVCSGACSSISGCVEVYRYIADRRRILNSCLNLHTKKMEKVQKGFYTKCSILCYYHTIIRVIFIIICRRNNK